MKNLRVLILGGLLTGSLVIAGTPAMADPPGLHKGWEKNHHGWVKGDDDDDRYEDHYRHDAYYGGPYQYRHPYYGYRDRYYRHDVHNGVSDVRSARQGLAQNRQQLKSNVQQLKTDRAELRKDIRNRASRTEIAQDRAA